MEPDIAAKVVMNIKQNENVQVGVLIMDHDTTTASKLRETLTARLSSGVTGITQENILVIAYTPCKKRRCLTRKVIQYIQKCFSYAVAENKYDPGGLAKSLNQIVPHAFGEHENCNDSWCGNFINPEKYKHCSLSYGRDLVSQSYVPIYAQFVKVSIKR